MATDYTDRLDEETKKAQAAFPNPGTASLFGPTVPTLGTGLSGMTRTIAESGVGAAAAPAAATQAGNTATNSYDGKALNDILARENKARGEMAAMAPSGFATPSAPMMPGQLLVGEVAPGVTRQDAENAEKTRRWQMQDLVDKASRGNQAAVAAAINSIGQMGQQEMRSATDAQRAGIDYMKAAGHDQVLARGQDISGANEAIRAGIDAKRIGLEDRRVTAQENDSKRAGEKWGIERKTMEGAQADSDMVRSARAELIAAQQSGDPAKIAAAKDKAIAAGIKFDKPTQEFTYVANPLGGGVIVNKDTGAASMFAQDGKKTAEIPAAVAKKPTVPTYEAFSAQIQAKNPGAKLTQEQIQQAYKAQFGG